MRFKYSQLPSVKSKVVLAPIVPITFKHKDNEFSTFALVDSGASSAMISTVIAEVLGIDWDKIPTEVGFTPSGQFRFHTAKNIEAEINGNKFSINLSIAEGISPYQCIFGQKDIFQKAKIIFEAYNQEFEIIFRDYN